MSRLDALPPEEQTFRIELKRSIPVGILEGAAGTFLLLIAVKYLHTGATTKAMLVAGVPLGHLLSPLAIVFVRHRQWTAARGLSFFGWLGAFGFTAAALGGTAVYIAGSMLGLLCLSASTPLVTQIYHENFPERLRGRLFSRIMMLRVCAMALSAWAAGAGLDQSFEYYRALLLLFAAAAAIGAWWSAGFPSRPLPATASFNPLKSLRHVRHDLVFRWILVSWMFMGIGSLVMVPLRIEHLGDPRYGIGYSPLMIAVFVTILPAIAQLVFSLPFGWLFDRMNFFLLRIVINALIICSMYSFFIVDSLTGYCVAGILFGAANAGGSITWSLWVTKIAPINLVAEYMGVHAFLTGVRAFLAPFIGFYLASIVPMNTLAVYCILSIILGLLILIPEARTLWARRQGTMITPKPCDGLE